MDVSKIIEQLMPLMGLQLSISRRAADMLILHFGDISVIEGSDVVSYALHIQCAWRIEGVKGIITGRDDLWIRADDNTLIDDLTWDYDRDKNMQDTKIGELLQSYDVTTRSFRNATDLLVLQPHLVE